MNKINNSDTPTEIENNVLPSNLNTSKSSNDFQFKFDVLLHTIPDGLVLLQDEKIKYSNKIFADMLGYTIDEITA